MENYTGVIALLALCLPHLLFMIGKFAIGAYLGRSAVASRYGAAGSVILIRVGLLFRYDSLFRRLIVSKVGKR